MHHIPGRLRIRCAALKRNPAEAERLRQWLESIPGVQCARTNVVTGSALIQYDVRVADGVGLIMLLEDEGWLAPAAPGAPPVEPRPAQPRRVHKMPPAIKREVTKAILTAVAQAAIERSFVAIAAAIL